MPPNDSEATGTFTATTDGTYLDYTPVVENIVSATQAHIHLGAAGENGGVVAFLFGPDEDVASIDASGRIAAADLLADVAGDMAAFLEALNSGNAYVNVHTAALPPGEVRGQISVEAVAEGVEEEAAGDSGGADTAEVTALPSTGSGGLAATANGGTAWLWALLAAALTLTAGVAVRRVWISRR